MESNYCELESYIIKNEEKRILKKSYQCIGQCIFGLSARLQYFLCQNGSRWNDRRSLLSTARTLVGEVAAQPAHRLVYAVPCRTSFAWIGQGTWNEWRLFGNGSRLLVRQAVESRRRRSAAWCCCFRRIIDRTSVLGEFVCFGWHWHWN